MHIVSCNWWNIDWYTKSGINDLYLYFSIGPLSAKKKYLSIRQNLGTVFRYWSLDSPFKIEPCGCT